MGDGEWSREELLLVLDLYLNGEYKTHEEDNQIRQMANIIGRTPASVLYRLGNYKYLDTNGDEGLSGYSQGCKEVWEEFSDEPGELREKAEQIRKDRNDKESTEKASLFLAPASNDKAFKHLEDTVLRGVPADQLEEFTDREFDEEIISVWGNREGTKAPWEKIKPGDFLLFYRDGSYGHAAEVIGTEVNEELARELWPDDDPDDPWRYIMYLGEPFQLDLPGEEIQDLAGYEIPFVMGFQSLNEKGHENIREQYGSIPDFLQEKYARPVQKPTMVRNRLSKTKEESERDEELPSEVEEEIRSIFSGAHEAYSRPYTLKCLLEKQEQGTVRKETFRKYVRTQAEKNVLPGVTENYPSQIDLLFENYGVFLLRDEEEYGIKEGYRQYIQEMQDLVEELWNNLTLLDTRRDLDIDIKEADLEGKLYFADGQDERLANQITSALNAGKHIIFTGPPGTGKTELAELVSEAVADQEQDKVSGHKLTTATADWSTFDTVGGYMPGDDNADELEFKPGQVLRRFRDDRNPQKNELLVIDEINRADIDKAFGQLFTLLSGQDVQLPFKTDNGDGRKEEVAIIPARSKETGDDVHDNEYVVPESWRILATMNTYDKTSLYEMSYAFMRRFAFIRVEPPKLEEYDEDGEKPLADLLRDYNKVWGIELDEDDEDTTLKELGKIWKATNTAVEGRKIGPAIVQDMLAYIANRGDSEAARTEAVVSYVLPQLEGVRKNGTIVKKIIETGVDEDHLKQVARDMLQVSFDEEE